MVFKYIGDPVCHPCIWISQSDAHWIFTFIMGFLSFRIALIVDVVLFDDFVDAFSEISAFALASLFNLNSKVREVLFFLLMVFFFFLSFLLSFWRLHRVFNF